MKELTKTERDMFLLGNFSSRSETPALCITPDHLKQLRSSVLQLLMLLITESFAIKHFAFFTALKSLPFVLSENILLKLDLFLENMV